MHNLTIAKNERNNKNPPCLLSLLWRLISLAAKRWSVFWKRKVRASEWAPPNGRPDNLDVNVNSSDHWECPELAGHRHLSAVHIVNQQKCPPPNCLHVRRGLWKALLRSVTFWCGKKRPCYCVSHPIRGPKCILICQKVHVKITSKTPLNPSKNAAFLANFRPIFDT